MSLKNFLRWKIGAALTLCALFAWTGCTVKDADNDIAMPDDEQEEEGGPISLADEELQYNHYLLSVFYLAANTHLHDVDWYVGYGEKAGFSSNYYEYPDVYYMYNQMEDNYTFYIGPYYTRKQDLSSTTDATYNLAVTVEDKDSSGLYITQVFPNGPGEKAGLKVGDKVLAIDATEPGDVSGFNKLSTGNDGDSLSLKVVRESDTLNIKAQLFCYNTPTVFVTYKDSIPVIKITEFASASAIRCEDANDQSFEDGSADEFEAALKATKGPTVIDLRGNGGGSMDQCLAMAEEFLSLGDTISILEYTDIAPDSVSQLIRKDLVIATKNGAGKGRYYVFLADTNTASCSEVILMGATLNLKSPVVGQITYGKSIGQYYLSTLAFGYGIITSMKMYDKNGVSPHDVGILPDYEIADTLKALDKAVELAKAGKEKRSKGYGTKRLHHFTDAFAKKATDKRGLPKGGAYRWKEAPPMKK
jgi:C-terminal processing protease CtpA/Prc